MEVMHERVAGLDVHKAMIVACVRIMAEGKIKRECRTFETSTASLEALLDWLTASRCTHVAMEATGVYWKPVWNILSDGAFELIVANAAHIKNVPGRKTDVNDATWIADLVACGLIRPSFVPGEAIQELRSLLRARKQLSREQTSHIQRIQKTLEEANIKLDSVISDIMGVSGRRMIEAMIAGVRNPHKLAALADRRIKASPKVLYDALHGRLTDHHRFMLRLHLEHYEQLEVLQGQFTQRIEEKLAPFAAEVELLKTIPGIAERTAEVLLAEIGPDLTPFPTANHLASWAGMCPGNNESAGKRRSGRMRKGNLWLRSALVQMAWAASRTKNTYLSAYFRRLSVRRGRKRALIALSHSMLVIIYHVLNRRTPYQDLGATYLDQLAPERLTQQLVKRLERLGHKVTLEPQQAA